MGIYKRVRAGLFPEIQGTFKHWQENDGPSLSAAVAYYAVCSFFPLLLVLIFTLGLVLQFSPSAQDAQQRLLELMESQMSAALAGHVDNALNGIRTGTVVGGPLGIGALLLVGLGVFVQVDRAFDRIFDTGAKTVQGIAATIRNVVVRRLRAFLVLISVTILTMLGLVASLASSVIYSYVNTLPGAGFVWKVSHVLAMIALNWLLFSLLYMAFPKVPIRWFDAVRGGALAAVLWEGSRQVLALIVVTKKYSAYGIVGSVLALMLWCYVATAILLFAATYVRVLSCQRGAARE
jgi:membrane protein